MKQNQHQAGGKNNRAAQSKQARNSASAQRLTKRVKVRLPKVLANGVRKAAKQLGISKAEFIRQAIAHNLAGSATQLAVKGGAR